MRWVIFGLMAAATAVEFCRIATARRRGGMALAVRRYRRAAWGLGLTVYAAMAVQEGVLLFGGLLTWRNGLPLHLCAAMGLLTLPMLVTRNRCFWHASLYLGLPGAALALLFPAILETSWPALTRASFFAAHAGVLLAPCLPLALGDRPSPRGAWEAAALLGALALLALWANRLLGSNYLFVSAPIPGTPLEALARRGMTVYRLALAGLAALLLSAEGLLARLLAGERTAKKSCI